MMNLTVLDSASVAKNENAANEDAFSVSEGLCLVLDGATGLGQQAMKQYPTDAAWFVAAMSRSLHGHWAKYGAFQRSLECAIEECITEYERAVPYAVRPAYELPSAAMVAVAVEAGRLTVYRLGDCSAYVEKNSRAAALFSLSALDRLDGISIAALHDALKRGKSPQKARTEILPLLRKHRSMMNKPAGYGVLALSMDCLEFIEHRELDDFFKLELLLATDGFSAIEKYLKLSAEQLFLKSRKSSLEGVIKELRRLENDDSQMLRFPRLKPHDDATAMRIGVEHPL